MHNHVQPGSAPSRRDFFRAAIGATVAGASILELAHHRAAWARGMAATAENGLFDIQKVAEGVYFAQARPQAEVNCNAAIFVNSNDVLVVDAHSKPSAAASLIAQLKTDVTPKPVRYLVNSHFHWDHTQGNHAYKNTGSEVAIIASEPTKRLLTELAQQRLKASLDEVPKQLDALRARAAKSGSAAEKAFCAEQIRQLEGYQTEMKNYAPELPTVTVATSHVIKDKDHELHIAYHGHAHTAGDVTVFCPQKRAIATGDMIHGFLPFIADGYPKVWPKTIDAVARLDFAVLMGGHGPAQQGRQPMTNFRNYIEELSGRVETGKKAGRTLAEIQKTVTIESLRSMQSNGYAKFVMDNESKGFPSFGPREPLQTEVNTNIAEVYANLDKM